MWTRPRPAPQTPFLAADVVGDTPVGIAVVLRLETRLCTYSPSVKEAESTGCSANRGVSRRLALVALGNGDR